MSEDEPTARAPLPPLLRGAPAEAGERQMPDPAPSCNQSGARAPAIRFDRAKPQLSQKKPRPHSASYIANSVANKRQAPARLGIHSMNTASRRQDHRGVASEKTRRRDRSRAELAIGQLSPRAATTIRRSKAPPSPRRSRGERRPSIIPITLPVRPHLVTPRAIPTHGHHPDLGSFDKDGPSPEWRAPCEGM